MLISQNFCRGHQAGLVLIVERNEHTHKRHHRLTAAYIPLQQTVHLLSRTHIGPDLPDNPFLCISQFKSEMPVVKIIEVITNCSKHMAIRFLQSRNPLFQQPELDKEQLFELQPGLCLCE